MLELKQNIEARYITKYGAEIGEVFCCIFERNKDVEPVQDFFNYATNHKFFNVEKFDRQYFYNLPLITAKDIMISSIIKEAKYNEHFMTWNDGNNYLNKFLGELTGIEYVFTNSNWKKSSSKNSNVDELDLISWSGISTDYWYDYGFIVVTEKNIGILWFGDES